MGHHPYWNEAANRDRVIRQARRLAGDAKRREIARGNRERLYGEYLALGEDVRAAATLENMAAMLGTKAERLSRAIKENEKNAE